MKAANTILKIVSALVFIAGAVFVVATYGDKIVTWAKKLLASCPCCKEEAAEAPAEEAVAEEAPVEEAAEEAPAEETPVEEAPAEEEEIVANEADFEG